MRHSAVLVAVGLLLAACGDSDETAPTTTVEAGATSVPETTVPQLVGEGEPGSTDEPPDVTGDGQSEPTDPGAPETTSPTGQNGQTTQTEPDGTMPPGDVIETTIAPQDRLAADDPYCVAGVAMNEAFAAGNDVPDDVAPVVAEALFAVVIERAAALAAVEPRPDGAPRLDEFAGALQKLNDVLADVGFDIEFFEDDGSLDAELEILDSESEALLDHVSAVCDVQDVDGDPAALAAELIALDQ